MREIPQGGRTATMGGVGVAAGSDSAMPLLNPAGIAGTPTDLLSVSADVYSATRLKIPRYFRPNGVNAAKYGDVQSVSDEDYSIQEIDSIPSGVAYFTRVGPADDPGRHVLGVSLTLQNYLLYNHVGAFGATTSTGNLREDVVVAEQYTQYLAGPSYAVRLGDWLRLGASVLATYGRETTDTHDDVLFSQTTNGNAAPNARNIRTRVDASSIGVTAVLGAQARVAPYTWVGGTFESMGIPLYGSGQVLQNVDVVAVDPTKAGHANANLSFNNFQIRRPFRISVGAAYQVPKSFAVGADVHAWLPQGSFVHLAYNGSATTFKNGAPPLQQDISDEQTVDTRMTLNGSLGGEVFLTEKIALRAGIGTDRDALAAVQAASRATQQQQGTATVQQSRLDWYFATLGVGMYEGVFETTYGAAFRYGVGTQYVPDYFNSQTQVGVDYNGWGVMVILSGSVKLEKEKPDTKGQNEGQRPGDGSH
jgi:hypothetical protein